MPAKCMAATVTPITTAQANLSDEISRVSARKRNASRSATSDAATRMAIDTAITPAGEG